MGELPTGIVSPGYTGSLHDDFAHKVYEDDHVLAFLDVAPLSKGHVLVIPKEEASSLHELSKESGAALGSALVAVAKAVVKATGATNYNILQNNDA
jgi:histidine triad (HIT) family protein